MAEAGGHCWWKIVLIVLHALVYAASLLVSNLANNGGRLNFNTFRPGLTNISANSTLFNVTGREGEAFQYDDIKVKSARYSDSIRPSGWTFSIWSFIYAWQVLHILYSLSLTFRRNSAREFLYNAKKPQIHFSFYLMFMLSNFALITWNFVFDRGVLIASFAMLVVAAAAVYTCGAIVAYSINNAAPMLEKSKMSYDIWLTRMITLNGVAFFGTWSVIAMLLSLKTMLMYVAQLNDITTVWVFLGILTFAVVHWFVFETFLFDRYLRYVFSPYLILVVALIGIIDKHWATPVPTHIYYVAGLFALVGVFAVVKMFVMFIKGCRTPIVYNTEEASSEKYHEMNKI